jgi:hypothetical protein
MRKLISLVLILAMPAMAFGATGYAVQVGGAASAEYEVGSVPNSLDMDIILSLDATGDGTFGFFGALAGPANATVSRTFNAPVSSWGFIINEAPAYNGKPLSELWDFGAIEIAGTVSLLLNAGANDLMTLTVSGLSGLGEGTYNFTVVSSADQQAGAAWSNTGEPILVDAVVPFVLKVVQPIPEPATMLLLAGALPFLRRRSA